MRWTITTPIDAPAARVWELTTAIEGWPAMTPTVTVAELLDPGPLRVGSRARLVQPGQRPAVWTVTELEPGRSFTWRSARPGLAMVGTHVVEPAGDGCTSTLALELAGPLARLVAPLAASRARRTIATENAGLKAAAEG